jgi:hypothetical protein
MGFISDRNNEGVKGADDAFYTAPSSKSKKNRAATEKTIQHLDSSKPRTSNVDTNKLSSALNVMKEGSKKVGNVVSAVKRSVSHAFKEDNSPSIPLDSFQGKDFFNEWHDYLAKNKKTISFEQMTKLYESIDAGLEKIPALDENEEDLLEGRELQEDEDFKGDLRFEWKMMKEIYADLSAWQNSSDKTTKEEMTATKRREFVESFEKIRSVVLEKHPKWGM